MIGWLKLIGAGARVAWENRRAIRDAFDTSRVLPARASMSHQTEKAPAGAEARQPGEPAAAPPTAPEESVPRRGGSSRYD